MPLDPPPLVKPLLPPALPSQDTILNVSLTAVTMLWNVSDQLTRSSKAAAAAAASSLSSGAATAFPSSSSTSGLALMASAGWLGGGGGGGSGGGTTASRRDVSEADGLEMLRIAFRALYTASRDVRPEVGVDSVEV